MPVKFKKFVGRKIIGMRCWTVYDYPEHSPAVLDTTLICKWKSFGVVQTTLNCSRGQQRSIVQVPLQRKLHILPRLARHYHVFVNSFVTVHSSNSPL